ncbi:MAG: hypothetical protein R2695_03575 [Acidimicrobiales bacterium]
MTRAFELAREEAVRVIVPSEATAADCRAHGVDADRLDVVPWGCCPPTSTITTVIGCGPATAFRTPSCSRSGRPSRARTCRG